VKCEFSSSFFVLRADFVVIWYSAGDTGVRCDRQYCSQGWSNMRENVYSTLISLFVFMLIPLYKLIQYLLGMRAVVQSTGIYTVMCCLAVKI
jgi:hypothetical protein